MKLRIVCTACLVWLGAALMAEGPQIRVLLEKEANAALLEVKGSYRVVRKDTGALLSTGSMGKRYTIHALQNGLRWGEEYPGVYAVTLVPTSEESVLYVDGFQYKGTVSVYHAKRNQITVVNELSVEDFLKSQLSIERPRLAGEALSAYVIAERTMVLGMLRSQEAVWDVTKDEVHYLGAGIQGSALEVEKAIDHTQHMCLESKREHGALAAVSLSVEVAEELAERGMDARKILESIYPHAQISLSPTLR